MKLMFQIAGGIIIAAVLMFIGSSIFGLIAVNSLNESIKEAKIKSEQKATEAKIIREIKRKNKQIIDERKKAIKAAEEKKLKIKNMKKMDEIRKRNLLIDMKMEKEREKARRKKEAWNKYYEEPYQCKHINTQKMWGWCDEYKRKTKKEFNLKVENGEIELI